MSPIRTSIVLAVGWLLCGCALFTDGGVAKPKGPVVVPFIVDSTKIGTLTVIEEYGALVLDARMDAPWSIAGARIYAGPGALPQSSAGSPDAESFPYAIDLPEPVADYSLELPLSAVGGGCGESLTAAVRLSVVAQTPQGQRSRVVWAQPPVGGPELVFTPRCLAQSTAAADAEIFSEEISDEFIEERTERESVAER